MTLPAWPTGIIELQINYSDKLWALCTIFSSPHTIWHIIKYFSIVVSKSFGFSQNANEILIFSGTQLLRTLFCVCLCVFQDFQVIFVPRFTFLCVPRFHSSFFSPLPRSFPLSLSHFLSFYRFIAETHWNFFDWFICDFEFSFAQSIWNRPDTHTRTHTHIGIHIYTQFQVEA